MKSVCIIGAGPAGLCAIKHCIAMNFEVVAFESNDQVGGTWVLTDQIGPDKYGLDIHSSMYQNLLINVPKEIIEFPEFPYPFEERCYITSYKMLNYFNLYADQFKLRDKIKFQHYVMRVCPLLNKSWEVIVKILPEDKYETLIFDAVFVCNGFSAPRIPWIIGQNVFKGQQLHSHDYRSAQSFINKKVLIIGGGPSGIEIALQLGKLGSQVFWSNQMLQTYGRTLNINVAKSVLHKVYVTKLTENGAVFEDGTLEECSTIIYCTGYSRKFPFLSADCLLSSDGGYVYPLYKHCVNINKPTLAVIKLPYFAVSIPMIDLQIRFVLKYWTGLKDFPSKTDMMKDLQSDQDIRLVKGFTLQKAHFLGKEFQESYLADLAKTAEIEPLKSVITKIFNVCYERIFENFNTYRNYDYKVMDDENFEESLGNKCSDYY